MNEYNKAFSRLYDVVVKLRAPDGCPWDREQTPSSLRKDLMEETYECIEAIDEKDPAHIKEELGDLFLLVTMISYMHEQDESFTLADVLDNVSEKLIRRHPHVFGDVKVSGSNEVLDNWAKIKIEQEGRAPKDSILDEVSSALPPLDKAWKLQKKASKVGFDWPEVNGVFAKIDEELNEVKDVLDQPNMNAENLEAELGDLLFSVVNLCRFFKVDASMALQRTNAKFIKRFKHVEKRMKESNQSMTNENLELMDSFWDEAKGE
ncbi:MAG: nucleoside triphosphate pyrophosphohydrolase [Treponema sp.]|nr:nucleoside triphosphate pyrophosphohydrolase [Treponema sp.]